MTLQLQPCAELRAGNTPCSSHRLVPHLLADSDLAFIYSTPQPVLCLQCGHSLSGREEWGIFTCVVYAVIDILL